MVLRTPLPTPMLSMIKCTGILTLAEAAVHALTGGAVPLTHLPLPPAEEVTP